MMKKAAISWSVKQINKMIAKGSILFDNAVQRGYEWDKKRSSLLIHSLICGYPVPAFYAIKREDGKYDMLDGKQRMTTIARFYNNEFALTEVPGVDYEIDGVELSMSIDDCKYENLPEEIRDELDSTILTVYYFDEITEEEIAEMFFRLNNGKPVSSSVLTRVRAVSKEKIKEIGNHPIFQKALTQKALESYTNEDIAIKALYALSGANNMETKNIRKWISETEVTDIDVANMKAILSRIERAAESISKKDKKVAKKILTKTHMLSIIPVIDLSRELKVKDNVLEKWLYMFFGTKDTATVSPQYNEACTNGSGKKDQVTTRYRVLDESFNSYVKEHGEDELDTEEDGSVPFAI